MNPFNLNALKLPMREPKLIAQAFQMMPGVSASSLENFLSLCHEDSPYEGEVWNFSSGAKLSRSRRITRQGRVASAKLHMYGYAADKSDLVSAHKYMKAALHLLQAKELLDASEKDVVPSSKRQYTGLAWEYAEWLPLRDGSSRLDRCSELGARPTQRLRPPVRDRGQRNGRH